jgi:hypothetical protein
MQHGWPGPALHVLIALFVLFVIVVPPPPPQQTIVTKTVIAQIHSQAARPISASLSHHPRSGRECLRESYRSRRSLSKI